LWAYEFDAGKFIAGEILGDTLYMYAPTGRGEKWVMNSEGVVLEYSSEPFHKSDEIIAGINAHYGTSFNQEDDIDKDFTIGETMPNWNAYEKIEMSHYDIAVAFGTIYLFGHVDGHIYTYSAKENGGGFPANANGIIQEGELTNPQSELYEGFIQTVKTKLSGYNVTTVTWEIKTYQKGDQIENWEDYVKV
jgi:hypothetical protein